MSTSTHADDFFKVGGALDPDAPSYVTRQADEELMGAVLSGQYCNVLTARQMGKSSLMVRSVRRLQEAGARTVVIDLSGVGTGVSPSEWYFGLISRFKRQLGLRVDEAAWWSERGQLGPVQRFSDFLRQVVLEEVREPIVVFIDEIDSTLNLPFTDDFFAAIRAAYNARASDAAYKRLTFVLQGVARPSDLIKERTRTPYNIGTSIDLRDFTAREARMLLAGLERTTPDGAEEILERVRYWTGGHPYLTQKVCAEVVAQTVAGDGHWTDERIDNLVKRLFLAEEARKETNLQFVRDRFGESRERGGMLRVYHRVWAGKRVQDEERSVVKSQLKLTGLVKATSDGRLAVRNHIYAQVFDGRWIKENMPVSAAQRLAIAATAVAVLALLVVAGLLYRQQTLPDQVRADVYTNGFLQATNAEVRLTNLAGLFELAGYQDQARELFFGLGVDEQTAMFEGLANPQQVGREALSVVKGVYQDQHLENSATHNRLLGAMAEVLHQVAGAGVPGAEVTTREIDYWLAGRQNALQGQNDEAVGQYELAIGLNPENPHAYFDRALAYVALTDYRAALDDLEQVIRLDREWLPKAQGIIEGDGSLFEYLGTRRDIYPDLALYFPTLTPTPTPTPTSTPTPTPTNTPTPTPTPTAIPPTHTPTSTPIPPVQPEPVAPAQGGEYRNPITFQWRGQLSAGQAYQVVVYHLTSGYTVQSGLLTDQGWTTDLPAERYGEWRWQVSVIRNGRVLVTSVEWMFWFNPSLGQPVHPSPGQPVHPSPEATRAPRPDTPEPP